MRSVILQVEAEVLGHFTVCVFHQDVTTVGEAFDSKSALRVSVSDRSVRLRNCGDLEELDLARAKVDRNEQFVINEYLSSVL